MFSLNAGGRGLILPQLNVPEFVDSPWEPLTIQGNGWGWAGGEERWHGSKGRGRTVVGT